MARLWAVHTVGHGTLAAEALAALLDRAGVEALVDVRSYPGSRRNPQFGREPMEQWVPNAGLEYTWMPALGGRRRPEPSSTHTALRNDAFRAYADHMETAAFRAGVDELLAHAEGRSVAVMCSESVWWRCHRRLLADHLVLVRRVDVTHLMHDGRLVPHPLTAGVRLAGTRVVYDVGADRPLSGAESEPGLPSGSDGGEGSSQAGEGQRGEDEAEVPESDVVVVGHHQQVDDDACQPGGNQVPTEAGP